MAKDNLSLIWLGFIVGLVVPFIISLMSIVAFGFNLTNFLTTTIISVLIGVSIGVVTGFVASNTGDFVIGSQGFLIGLFSIFIFNMISALQGATTLEAITSIGSFGTYVVAGFMGAFLEIILRRGVSG